MNEEHKALLKEALNKAFDKIFANMSDEDISKCFLFGEVGKRVADDGVCCERP